jgi:radical SAM superfamily enzyme YgiQ (UPF0313 family)
MIVLVGVNARYTHTNLALRYLRSNLKELKSKSKILEFTINEDENQMVEQILLTSPKIVGISVYIWNAIVVQKIVEIIKQISPQIKVVLGGPEVSYQPFRVDWSRADYIVQGEGEITFYDLCKNIVKKSPSNKVLKAILPNVKEVEFPYDEYSDEDIRNRYIYVEASRGCPYECEFCLSSIDKKVRYFDIDRLILEYKKLWDRGARKFKFIDRTFNLNIPYAIKLLDFFLEQKESYSLHFEVIPDNFPTKLKEKIVKFPPQSLQLEIGIQSLNLDILKNINRDMNLKKLKNNIEFLEKETNAHLHVDLIIGLPGESIESFAKNLNELKGITDSEIQIGILKKLSGTTISRYDEVFNMVYNSQPPYEILQNDYISFLDLQHMKRFARFWDLVYNSGNFHSTKDFLWRDSTVFDGFYHFSSWIYNQTNSTWKISLVRLSELIFNYLTDEKRFDKTLIADTIIKDVIRVRGRKVATILHEYATHIPNLKELNLNRGNRRQLLRDI